MNDDGAKGVDIKLVPVGEYIKRKADAKKVWVRGEYDRASKSYECTDTEDIGNSIFIKSGRIVFVGFTY